MANTCALLHDHLVFSAKNRVGHITPEIEQRVRAYIGGLARHHKKRTFQEEYPDFLQKHEVECDERYVWG